MHFWKFCKILLGWRLWGAAVTWHPALLRLPSGHAGALMCHGLDLQAGLGTAAPHWQARQPHFPEVGAGTALLAKEGAVASLARALLELRAGQRLKTLQICGQARSVWGREGSPVSTGCGTQWQEP